MDYDLSNPQELFNFDADCCRAVRACPQEVASTTPSCQFGELVSVAGVFCRWFYSQILWRKGYSEGLSPAASNTFLRYAMLRDGRVFDTRTGLIFHPRDEFRLVQEVRLASRKQLDV